MTEPSPPEAGPVGLLLGRDLIFTSKVTGTARALGRRVYVAGSVSLATKMIGQWSPVVVFVDLSATDLASPESLLALRSLAPSTPFIAFGSHVDTASLAAASAAGCAEVMPRSRFTNELPALIRRHLGEATPETASDG